MGTIHASAAPSQAMKYMFVAWQVVLKRVLDIVVSASALLFLSPVIVLAALLVRLTSPGPAFFRWKIIGQDGRPIVGYKLRTMYNWADRMRDLLQHRNEMTGPFFKMKNDPRVTPIGRFLRRFSIDELPQLWSIVKGDMSLVGPRPTQVFEYEQLQGFQKERVRVKPGAVSSWIVSGKTTDFDEMVRLDLAYISQWSIWTDLRILFKAVPYVILGKNT